MIGQIVCAVCTLAVVILAILIMTRAISLDDALKAFGKYLAMFVLAYFLFCSLLSALHVAQTALTSIIKTTAQWLAAAVLILAGILLLMQLLRRRMPRSGADSERE